jgi:hypothetical protein
MAPEKLKKVGRILLALEILIYIIVAASIALLITQ